MRLWKKIFAAALALSIAVGGTAALAAKPDWAGKPAWNQKEAKRANSSGKKGGGETLHIGRGIQITVSGKSIILTFKDVEKEAAWALPYIVKLVKRGVFTGYEDGSFRPNQKVTRIEAITAAVRQMGLREEAESSGKMSASLQFKDADLIKKKYPWAVGYVAVAVENDLFLENEFSVHPEKPADRLWATILLVKALGLEDEAKKKMNTDLKFKDKKEIPAGAVGYVAVAVEKGLITGYENNTFRPNRPVTRAELAAILDRSGDQLPGDETGYGQFSGVFAGFANDGKLRLMQDGKTKSYAVADHVTVLRGNAWAELEDLKAGDALSIVVSEGEVIFIHVTKPASVTDGQYSGTVAAVGGKKLTIVKDGKTTEFAVADNATVIRNNGSASLKDIAVGDTVTVIVVEGRIVHVTVTATAPQQGEVTGVIAAVYKDAIDLAMKDRTVKYTFDSAAAIVRHGEVVGIEALQPGDEVKLFLSNGKVLLLTVTKPVSKDNKAVYSVTGIYEGHRTKDGKVTQISISTAHNGTVVTRVYNVAEDAIVNGNALALEKGVTELELVVVNQEVTAITIQPEK